MRFRAIALAYVRALRRDWGSIFLLVLFPMLYSGLLGLGLHVTFGKATLGVLRGADDRRGSALVEELGHSPLFRIIAFPRGTSAEDAFASHRLDGVLEIADQARSHAVRFVFDERSPDEALATQERVTAVVNQFDLRSAGVENQTLVQTSGLRGPLKPSFDYLIPRIVMFSAIFAVLNVGVARAVRMRERGVFKRLMVTPLSPRTHVGAEVASRSVIAAVQTLIVLAMGVVFFHASVSVSTLWLLAIAATGAATFMCLGLMISAVIGTSEIAMGVTALVGYFLIFVSGGLPESFFPRPLVRAVSHLPLRPMVDAMRGVLIDHRPPWSAAPGASLQIGIWLIGASALAFAGFRFRTPSRRT